MLAVVVLTAACGNLPRPFAPEVKAVSSDISLLPIDGAGVVVDAVDCRLDAEEIVSALGRREIAATLGPGNRGSIRLVCSAVGEEIWSLFGGDNQKLGDFPATTPDSVAQNLLVLIGRDVVPPSGVQRYALVVTPVQGAPGDGAVALSRAMALALKGRGQTLASTPDDTTLLVMGTVMLTDRGEEVQYVEIIWELLSPDGARLGIVSQENTIEAGSLDGPWGSIAPVIASAGADGMVDLINRISAP